MSRFEQTRWSVVLRAGNESTDGHAALESLCRTYRSPVLAYVRSRGHTPDQAEDLTQAFFMRFLEREWYCDANPDRGRFRAFLLTALKRFLSDANSEARAIKRGGEAKIQPLDEMGPNEPIDAVTPEDEFERAWVRAVLNTAFVQLRAEAGQVGKLALFDRLSEFLVERPSETDYACVAEVLHLRRNTVAVAVHRLRERLHELVRKELGETAASSDEAEGELQALRKSLDAVAPSLRENGDEHGH
ncbi:MAG: sigma-70 family RNA polymerase sigma factor [Rhodanobacter sp.]